MNDVTTDDIRRLAHLFTDMTETRGWQEFKRVVNAQIAERERLVLSPFHDMSIGTLPNSTLQERMIALESVKGAIIGLRLALSIPETTIQHAADIVREEGESNG